MHSSHSLPDEKTADGKAIDSSHSLHIYSCMHAPERDDIQTRAAALATVGAMALAILLAIPTYMPKKDLPLPDPTFQVNPNTAAIGQLLQLPGMGPARAKALVEYRQMVQKVRSGPVFRDVNDLMQVPGLGPDTVKRMAGQLCFE